MNPASYRTLADALVAFHFAFVCFVFVGAVLVLRWRRVAFLHLPAVAWGIFIEASHGTCPLTPLENELRHWAGQAGYDGGFIEHYVRPVLYPAGLTDGAQLLIAAAVVLINGVCYGRMIYRTRRNRREQAKIAREVDPVTQSPATAVAGLDVEQSSSPHPARAME